MIELKSRQILIDGQPKMILAGEVHYFRLERHEWLDRITKAKEVGCQAIASYIPWLIHQEKREEPDVTGIYRPENAVGEFIDLCEQHGLWFIARPGPFIMAEMKNEGLPYWVYKDHPEIIPISWKEEKARSRTVDYLAPNFLAACREWYSIIIPVLASRLQPKGGNVIGIQLDNEIGMLSWVYNQPDLTDHLLNEFADWAYSEGRAIRYGFDFRDVETRNKSLRSPDDVVAPLFRRDYADYQRVRFDRYVQFLAQAAKEFGAEGVPFIINIHGSGGGKGTTFPIGISQLYQSYSREGFISGSDHYLGELTRDNFQDLWLIDAFMEAVHTVDQPLTSMEFEAGSGDYGDSGGRRYGGEPADFKAKLSAVKGNRLLNYYLIAGGRNPQLRYPVGDGNDRVAFTGERHGFAAPINPEGERSSTYQPLKATTQAINALSDFLAVSQEELDDITIAFIPDYYTTDFWQPGAMKTIVDGLQSARYPLEQTARGLLLSGIRFGSFDLQNRPLSPEVTPLLIVATSPYLSFEIQLKLADYVDRGGILWLTGRIPTMDMEGQPCTLLMDALGLKAGELLEANIDLHLSVIGQEFLSGSPEIRIGWCQPVRGGTPLFRIIGSEDPAGVTVSYGQGKALVMGFEHPSHHQTYQMIAEHLGMRRKLDLQADDSGVIAALAKSANGSRCLLLMNLDSETKEVRPKIEGWGEFVRPVTLEGRKARLLPLNQTLGGITLLESALELSQVKDNEIEFFASLHHQHVVVKGHPRLQVTNGSALVEGENTVVTSIPLAPLRITLRGSQ